MGRRTRVPAALHSELSEYSSLIRALRTNNALDLTAQLTSSLPASVAETAHYEDDHDHDDQEILARTDETEVVNPVEDDTKDSEYAEEDPARVEEATAHQRERKVQRNALKAKLPKDTWTRWPLLAGDVHAPEWTFEDEVRLLAERSMRKHTPTASDPDVAQEAPSEDPADGNTPSAYVGAARKPDLGDTVDDDDLTDSLLTEYALDGLAASTSRYLSQLLALLATYVPAGEKSMQNRVHPINWESVLDIAAVNGLVQPE